MLRACVHKLTWRNSAAFRAILVILPAVALLAQAFIAAFGFIVKAFADGVKHASDFVMSVVNFFTSLKTNIGNIFNAIGTFIHNAIMTIYNHNTYVKAFVDTVTTFLHTLQNTVSIVFSVIAAFIGQKLQQASGFVTNFKNAIGSEFNQIGTAIHNAVTAAWNWLTSFVSGWPAQAFRWGANLIQGLINGITSMIGGVINAASNVASAIAGFLGFHSPAAMGPGHDADTWMPNLMNMFTQGIVAGSPQVQRALTNVLAPVSASLSVHGSGLSPTSSVTGRPGVGAGSASGGHGPISIQNTFNVPSLTQQEMDRAVQYMADRLRSQMGNI